MADTSTLPVVRQVHPTRPIEWLALGLRDIYLCPLPGLLHGVAMALFGAMLVLLAGHRFWLLAGAFSGFLVVAPVLATSLYAISRAIEQRKPVTLGLLFRTWTSWQRSRLSDPGGYWCLVRFGLLLALAGTGWVITSAAFITLLSPQPVQSPLDFIHHVVLSRHHYLFEGWLVMGGILAAPVFASSVITMPLLLDRRINMTRAILTSWQAVLANPVTLAVWAAIIMALTLIGLASAFVGLLLVVPLLGHASWHAYRDIVDVSALEPREP